jgi:DNA repair protein RadC
VSIILPEMESINNSYTSIKNRAEDDKPREKLMNKGASALSDSELLAILINTGTGKTSAIDLAREVLKKGRNDLNELAKISIKELMTIRGIGEAKAVTLAAAVELGTRRQASPLLKKTQIRESREIGPYLQAKLKDYNHEVFAVVFLNRANKINHFEIISSGGITGTVADPRIILTKALENKATSIVLCHNHPSGNLKPSLADEELTLKIKEAARYLDISVLDHIIVSEEGYYSFSDEGML